MESLQQAQTQQQQFEVAKQLLWEAINRENLHNIEVILGANFPPTESFNSLGLTSLHYACTTMQPSVDMEPHIL